MATTLCALLWQIGRCQQLSAILAGGTYIDQRNVTMAYMRENLVAQGPDIGLRFPSMVRRLGIRWDFGRDFAFDGQPFDAATIQQANILVTIVLQDPERPGGTPVVIVAIQDNGGIIADPRPPQKLFQVCFAQWCPHHLVLQFFLPVEANGS